MKEEEARRKPPLELGRGQGQHSPLGIPWSGAGMRMWGCQAGRVLAEAGRGRLPHPHWPYPAPISTCVGQSYPVPGQGGLCIPRKKYPHPPKKKFCHPTRPNVLPLFQKNMEHRQLEVRGGQGREGEERGPGAQVAMVTRCKSARFLRLPHTAWMGAGSVAWISESWALALGARVLVGIQGQGGFLSLLYFSVVFATVKTGRRRGRC